MGSFSRTNPYVGPEAFKPKDAPFFFGRDHDAETLLSLMISKQVGLFYAQSGAGKTSLLNARLIPDLEKEGFEVLPMTRVGRELPEDASPANVYVFNTLQHLSSCPSQDITTLETESLPTFLQPKPDDGGAPRVLIFDQFEEILTTYPERWGERENFFLQLGAALKADSLLSVLFAMREDHIAGLDPYAPLLPDRLRSRFRMERLRFGEAIEAVRRPAALAGRRFAEGVAETLVDNLRQEHFVGRAETVAGEFVEPVQLQVVSYQLWENLGSSPDAEITAADLQASGDVDDALRSFYQSTIARVASRTGVSELQIRRFFSRTLITPGGIRAQVNRRPERTGALPNVALDQLLNEHLIRREEVRGGIWYELVHDRFIDPILASNVASFKRLRQRWIAVAALVGALVLVLTAAGWARHQAREKRLAVAAQLSREAHGVLGSHPPRSLWLAHRAASIALETDEVEVPRVMEILRQALQASRVKLVGRVGSGEVRWSSLDFGGETLATLDLVGQLRLWDVATGSNRQLPEGLQHSVFAVAFSGNGDWLATFDDRGAITVWDVGGFREPKVLSTEVKPDALAFSPDGNELVAIDQSGSVVAWDTESGHRIFSLAHPRDGFIDATFQPYGERLATAGFNGDIDVWDPGAETPALSLSNGDSPIVEFSEDGQTLFSVSQRGRFQLWDLSMAGPPFALVPSELRRLPESGTPFAQAITLGRERRSVTLVSAYGDVQIWDLYSNTSTVVLKGNEEATVTAAFSRDGRRLALSDAFATEVWEFVPEEIAEVFAGHRSSINSVAYSRDGRWIASGGDDSEIRIWDVRSEERPRVLSGHTKRVNAVAFSADSKLLVSASDDMTVTVWDLTAGKIAHSLHGHTVVVTAIDLSPDGRLVATASLDGTVKLWNTAIGTEIATFIESAGGVYSVTFSPDGQLLATGGPEGRVRFWEIETGLEKFRFDQNSGSIIGLAFSPDGAQVAAASKDSALVIRELASGRDRVLPGHHGWIHDVAFSPDGRMLASCDSNGLLVLWDVDSGVSVLSVQAESAIHSVAFSPDGAWLATGGEDALVRLEPLVDAELILLAEQRIGLEPRARETP